MIIAIFALTMTFSVTILGCSSALPTVNRFPSAQLVNVRDHHYLVDCGEGAQMQLRRYGIGFTRINHVLISHLHGDHLFGMFGLLSTMSMLGRKAPLHIFAPAGLQPILSEHLVHFGDGMTYAPVVHALNTERSEVVVDTRALTITSFPLYHRVPACGFLFQEKPPQRNIRKELIAQYELSLREIVAIKNGADYTPPNGKAVPNAELTYLPYAPRSYAYCSDTMFDERVAQAVQGVDLLYHEATYADAMRSFAVERGHSTALQAAQIAKMANAKQLALGHFSSRYKNVEELLHEAQSVFANTQAAEEGKVFHVAGAAAKKRE